jgi:hypothetical protein
MISTNELRIGNFVSTPNGFEMLVHSIFQYDTVYLDLIPPLINEADVWEEDYKDLMPIPLTEEWLLKAGFKEIKFLNEYRVQEKGYKHLDMIIRCGVCDEYRFLFDFAYEKCVNLKYVHQLQNLYFSLCGEELVFSTDV